MKWYHGYYWVAAGLLLPAIARFPQAPSAIDGVLFYLIGVIGWGSLASIALYGWRRWKNRRRSDLLSTNHGTGIVTPQSNRSNVAESPELADRSETIYKQIAEELASGTGDRGLWTRLYAECEGDEVRTKVLYIKSRAEKLAQNQPSHANPTNRNSTHDAAGPSSAAVQGPIRESGGDISDEGLKVIGFVGVLVAMVAVVAIAMLMK